MPELPPQRLIVLHFQWSEGGVAKQETYGPWTVADDELLLGQIDAFMKDWQQATGCMPASVTMAIVQDPAAWLAERRS